MRFIFDFLGSILINISIGRTLFKFNDETLSSGADGRPESDLTVKGYYVEGLLRGGWRRRAQAGRNHN